MERLGVSGSHEERGGEGQGLAGMQGRRLPGEVSGLQGFLGELGEAEALTELFGRHGSHGEGFWWLFHKRVAQGDGAGCRDKGIARH